MPKLINLKTGRPYFVSQEAFSKLKSNVLKAFKIETPREPDAVKQLKEKKLK